MIMNRIFVYRTFNSFILRYAHFAFHCYYKIYKFILLIQIHRINYICFANDLFQRIFWQLSNWIWSKTIRLCRFYVFKFIQFFIHKQFADLCVHFFIRMPKFINEELMLKIEVRFWFSWLSLSWLGICIIINIQKTDI